MNIKLRSSDPLIIFEFICVLLASTCFVVFIHGYLIYDEIYAGWASTFMVLILAKNLLEFFETHEESEDRRIEQILNDEGLPSMLRRQTDGGKL